MNNSVDATVITPNAPVEGNTTETTPEVEDPNLQLMMPLTWEIRMKICWSCISKNGCTKPILMWVLIIAYLLISGFILSTETGLSYWKGICWMISISTGIGLTIFSFSFIYRTCREPSQASLLEFCGLSSGERNRRPLDSAAHFAVYVGWIFYWPTIYLAIILGYGRSSEEYDSVQMYLTNLNWFIIIAIAFLGCSAYYIVPMILFGVFRIPLILGLCCKIEYETRQKEMIRALVQESRNDV